MSNEMPSSGETVVCKIVKILDYGVFVELQEYDKITGFVHISQVASSWVKNIRNFVKEGQIRAAEVLHIDFARKQIDLSFTKVSAGAQRGKIEAWNQLKRSQKILEIFAREQKSTFETVWKEIAEPLMQNYPSLQEAFHQIALNGKPALKGVNEKWHNAFLEIIRKNIEIPKRTVRGILSVQCEKPNGVECIREALVKARDSAKAGIELSYMGSGKWDLRASSFDFKTAEKTLAKVSETISELLKSCSGSSSFQKIEN